jgi:hypothetical protein
MPIVKITGQGLSAIALSVALLWGCVVEERIMNDRIAAQRARVLRDLEKLQRTSQPASAPLPRTQKIRHVNAG